MQGNERKEEKWNMKEMNGKKGGKIREMIRRKGRRGGRGTR